MDKDHKLVLLQHAADLMGLHELSARLQVPLVLLQAWIAGNGTIPDLKLSLLADALGPDDSLKPR